MANTTLPAMLAAITAALRARGGLAGVTISDAEPGDTGRATEHIVLGLDIVGEGEWGAMPRRRGERYSIEGYIHIAKGGQGEDVWTAARARAFALYAEIEDQVGEDPRFGVADLNVRVTNLTWTNVIQTATTTERWCALLWRLDVTAQF